MLKKTERIDDLQFKNLKLIQDKNLYSFSCDPVILVNLSKVKKDATVVDLCSGSGVIAILVAGKSRAKKVYGIELQECMADMAKRSVALNQLQSKVEIISDDLKNYNKYFTKNSIDVVFANPPYVPIKNEDFEVSNKTICRSEIYINLDELVKVASELLQPQGCFYMVHKASRIDEIIIALNKYSLALKELTFVKATEKTKAHLAVIKAVKNGGQEVLVNDMLILNNQDGSLTNQALDLYNKEKI